MISNFKNVFVLAPHTDDGELGAGDTTSFVALEKRHKKVDLQCYDKKFPLS